MPQFSVSAKGKAFEALSFIVTDLILFSDPVHRTRMDRLETFLFSYDFTDLAGAAELISALQLRIRQLLASQRDYYLNYNHLTEEERQHMVLVSAQIFVLVEELNLVFDAIGLAQDKAGEGQDDHQSALELVVLSDDISWHMLDDNGPLLAKLQVMGTKFSWLSKRDSSTTSRLTIQNMRALHSSPTAIWPEILDKYDSPPNHPMVKVCKDYCELSRMLTFFSAKCLRMPSGAFFHQLAAYPSMRILSSTYILFVFRSKQTLVEEFWSTCGLVVGRRVLHRPLLRLVTTSRGI